MDTRHRGHDLWLVRCCRARVEWRSRLPRLQAAVFEVALFHGAVEFEFFRQLRFDLPSSDCIA
jgi:hypothetical protein